MCCGVFSTKYCSKEDMAKPKARCLFSKKQDLEEETDDLATSVLAAGLLVVHDAVRGGEDNVTELTGRQKIGAQLLDAGVLDIEAGGDHTALIDAADQIDDDLAGAVIIDDLEIADVAVLLHDLQKFDNDLGGRADEHLSLATLLGINDCVETIAENGDTNHLVKGEEPRAEVAVNLQRYVLHQSPRTLQAAALRSMLALHNIVEPEVGHGSEVCSQSGATGSPSHLLAHLHVGISSGHCWTWRHMSPGQLLCMELLKKAVGLHIAAQPMRRASGAVNA